MEGIKFISVGKNIIIAIGSESVEGSIDVAIINDLLPSQAGNSGKNLSTDGTSISWVDNSETTASIAALLHGATLDTTPLDTDEIFSYDTSLSTLLRTTWLNVKAFLKTYFDSIYEPILSASSSSKYYRGDKTWQVLDKSAVGLGNVDNTSDANKPVSTAQAAAMIGFVTLASDIATTSTSFVDISSSGGALKFPVVSGETYWFKFVIIYSSGTIGRGSGWAINGPTLGAGDASYRAEWSAGAKSRQLYDGLTGYDATVANASAAATAGNIAIIEGIIKCSAAGNVIARMLSANSGNTITAKKFSSVQYKKIS